MIPIYICEDNQQQLAAYAQTVKNRLLFEETGLTLALATPDPYALLKTLRETKTTGLYFLDIDLQTDIDGLKLAQQIRALDPRGYIVFITTHSEMLALTFQYKVEAMDFILKDQPDQIPTRTRQCIDAVSANDMALQRQNSNLITLKIDNVTLHIRQSDIVFIESDSAPHKLTIHTSHGAKRFSGSLRELESLLDSRFCRCHNSILVNTEHITAFHGEQRQLLMDNGELYPVSIRMAAKIRRLLQS